MADSGVKARREWVRSITIDQTNRCAVGDTLAMRITIHHERRDREEGDERRKGNLPDDIDVHGVLRPVFIELSTPNVSVYGLCQRHRCPGISLKSRQLNRQEWSERSNCLI
jgi:hypothetical protein